MTTSAMAWTNPTSASERDGHHRVRTKKKTSLLLFPHLLSDGFRGKVKDCTKSVIKSLSLSLIIIMSKNKRASIALE
jgi:hypothetical protein